VFWRVPCCAKKRVKSCEFRSPWVGLGVGIEGCCDRMKVFSVMEGEWGPVAWGCLRLSSRVRGDVDVGREGGKGAASASASTCDGPAEKVGADAPLPVITIAGEGWDK
jgi:hypothetical protein